MTHGTTAEEGAAAARPDAAVQPWPDPALDRLATLAADLLGVETACLVLRRGEGAAVAGTSRPGAEPPGLPWAFPQSEPAPFAVADLSSDPRAARGVPAGPYAGAPVLAPDGARLGTLCAFGPARRPVPLDADRLAALAAVAADLLEARRRAERATAAAEAKADLLADISHEMRTPINGILGFTEVLRRDGGLAGEALRAAERIEAAGRGLIGIVGDALDLARLEGGLVRLDPRPFSPARLVEEAGALLRAEADRKGLSLVVDPPPSPAGLVVGDPDRLRQVVLNLLSNAVKFTDAGAVRLALAVGDGGPGVPVELAVTVEDSGVGIARDRLPRLFRRFAQADEGAARRHGGSGLGLAISKALVEAMGGSIAVESAPGAGTRFTVALSLPRAVDPRPLPPPRGPEAQRPAPDGLRGLAVLLADDAPLNQRLVRDMLEPLGAAVDVVADGAAAVAAARARAYALVLMDMEMPVLDGLAATRRIRALGGAAGSVPILALTANAFPEQLDRCRAAGMDDCLTKPFGADALAAAALRWARRPVPAGEVIAPDGGASADVTTPSAASATAGTS